jgi:hypothetical protein
VSILARVDTSPPTQLPGRRTARPLVRIALALVTALAALALLGGGLAPGAGARTTYIVRDGFYGGLGSDNTYTMLWVSHRRVYHLRFSAILSCHDIASNEDYERAFDAGKNMPQGEPIPASGRLIVNFVETSAERVGHIRALISFRHGAVADFAIEAPHTGEGLEDCTGSQVILLKRSPHNVPRPEGP